MSKAKSEITREEYLVTLNLFARSTQEERDHGPLRAALIAHVDALRQQLATARREVWLEAAKVAENEPELEGPIPFGIRIALEQSSLEDQQRVAVRSTKRCIAEKCREQAKKEQP